MANTSSNSYSQQPSYGFGQQNYTAPGYGSMNNQTQTPLPQTYQYFMPDANLVQLQGRPVGSIEEAHATPIKLDGTISYFPDIGNKRIYTKQFNPDGSVSLKTYIEDNSDNTRLKYVTQQELSDAITNMKNTIQSYLLSFAFNANGNNQNNISQGQPQIKPPFVDSQGPQPTAVSSENSQQVGVFNI